MHRKAHKGLCRHMQYPSNIPPPQESFKISVRHTNGVNAARSVVVNAQPETVSTAQTTLQ